MRRNTTRLENGTTVSVMPCERSEATSATPSPVPMTMPMIAPKTARITDSERIMARIWRRFIPTARSSPISWVRSNTDSMRVFTMPMRAMTIARPSSA